ncbi:glycosyl transferase family 2 [Geobacter metallireducens RCH3]|uniref:UDP-glucose--lipopolysaccharide core heptose I 4-beta-glucosyltransferase, putative n=1 Tax=Geobacter metallireducens (strain ATCC 53774 / DSM 7210 / GS-15) TaxID=269799 RepID=Q39RM1_GEOMG|nr:glycosyltransferase family 2 protein [Geobacter metallireducens]ABB33103.1 UDP-glucose--lipopolysaccharide core heptose I 4-beta-glucosyltransferase, putative [Geobacter metallireducens GS-15]EHP87102.1 glycosyl transferase family 2 [Geobacter metallireducens RCH3]
MTTISAVLIVRNEELNICSCLQTLCWCDEIVVVDMESEDRTVALARQFTNKIYSHEKVMAFDIARDFAVKQATCDWIFMIDADELVTNTLKTAVVSVVDENDYDVVYFPRINFIFGKWIQNAGWWPDYQARLFRNGAISFSGRVHNFIEIAHGSRIKYLDLAEDNAIIHFNYEHSHQFISKLNHYTSIEARDLKAAGHKFSKKVFFVEVLREFYNRYFKTKGYREGMHGLFLSLLMMFYRISVFIKLWECHEHEKRSVSEMYNAMKQEITAQHLTGSIKDENPPVVR